MLLVVIVIRQVAQLRQAGAQVPQKLRNRWENCVETAQVILRSRFVFNRALNSAA